MGKIKTVVSNKGVPGAQTSVGVIKGRRTPRKTDTGKGEAWQEAVIGSGVSARTINEMGPGASFPIVTHRAQVPDQPVSYAMGTPRGGRSY